MFASPTNFSLHNQDLPNAQKSWQLVDSMGLRTLRENPWHIQEMCATTGDGLFEGVTKLSGKQFLTLKPLRVFS